MLHIKYTNHKTGKPLNLELDGCSLTEWSGLCCEAIFAWHPNGFKIFISPENIIADDEYADSDPYTVEQNIDNEFHFRRKELTIGLLREAASQLAGTLQVLDLGCGQGHITEMMHKALSDAEFTGLDYSVSAIAYAHEHFPLIDFSVADAYACPYADASFDVIVCNNLWEHVPDPLHLLKSIKRILKPAGYLIVSTPSRYRLGNLIRILKGKPVAFLSQHHVTEYTVGQVKEQLTHGGLQVSKIVSRPISARSVAANVARWFFARLISLIGSHHQLEETVFFLARKQPAID